MTDFSPAVELAFVNALSTSSRRMQTAFDALLREKGLTLARARALTMISRNPGINQSELAKMLSIEGPTMVRLLDGMERQGFVARSVVSGDRRAKAIGLTEAALADLSRIEELAQVVGAFMLRGIAVDDLGATIRVLGQVTKNIEAAMNTHPPS